MNIVIEGKAKDIPNETAWFEYLSEFDIYENAFHNGSFPFEFPCRVITKYDYGYAENVFNHIIFYPRSAKEVIPDDIIWVSEEETEDVFMSDTDDFDFLNDIDNEDFE